MITVILARTGVEFEGLLKGWKPQKCVTRQARTAFPSRLKACGRSRAAGRQAEPVATLPHDRPIEPLPSVAMASTAAAACKRSRAGARPILAVAAAALLCLLAAPAGETGAFVAPRPGASAAGKPAAAPAVAALGTQEAGGSGIVDQVESLRRESLEACLLATEEDPNAVERCSALSYELAQAEQLLFKRQAAMRYVDHDSY